MLDGLSHNNVNCVIQDLQGLMWFGTKNGICSFDGQAFNWYELETGQLFYEGQTVVNDAIIDPEGNLLIGTTAGVFYYNVELDRFDVYRSSTFGEYRYKTFSLLSCNDKVWIGNNNSFLEYDLAQDTLIKVVENRGAFLDIIRLNEDNLLLQSRNRLFLYSISNRFFIDKSNLLSYATQMEGESERPTISNLHLDTNGDVWVSIDSEILIFSADLEFKGTLSQFAADFNLSGTVRSVKSYKEGYRIMGFSGAGLVVTDNKYNVLSFIGQQEDDGSDFIKNVSDIFIDSDNRIWISSYRGGVMVYDPNLFYYETVVYDQNEPQGIGNSTIHVVLADSRERIWYGTSRGVSIFNQDEGSWTHYYNNAEDNQLNSNIVTALCEVSKNEIWIGTLDKGINVYRYDSNRIYTIEELYPEFRSLNLAHLSRIYKDSRGNIWIGRIQNGSLIRINLQERKFKEYHASNCKEIFETSKGELYFANYLTIWGLNREKDIFERVEFDGELTIIRHINSINDYGDSLLLIGSDGGGLFVYNPENKKIRNYSIQQGLVSNNVSSLLVDGEVIWITTSNGISKFRLEEEEFVSFDARNNLEINSFSPLASVRLNSGKLVFGGSGGAIVLDPDNFRVEATKVKIRFAGFIVNNSTVDFNNDASPLLSCIDRSDKIELEYNQNSFSFEFSGMNYTNPSQNMFSWKLEGFEASWTEFSTKNSATYTNIPRGDYIFKLRLATPEGSADYREIHVKVLPSWWFSPFAVLLYAITILTILFILAFLLKIRFKEKKAKEKISFFINIAHDLKTPLALIKTPLTSLVNNNVLNERDGKYVKMALSNAEKINNYFNQLLDFQKSDMGKMRVDLQRHDLLEQLKEIGKNFEPLFQENKLDFIILSEEEEIEFFYDREILDKIFQNLLSNAVKYTLANGKIRVQVGIDDRDCVVRIIDTGIGIPLREQRQVFKRYFRASNAAKTFKCGTGVGLMLVRQLVELTGGQVSFVSKEGVGTEFLVRLPLRHSRQPVYQDGFHEKKLAELLSFKPVNEVVFRARNEFSDKNGSTDFLRILVVDDNQDLRELLYDSFKDEYLVEIAANGKEALSKARNSNVSLVISDIMMPEMDGRMLCHELKNDIQTCHIPVILLTALTERDYWIEGYESGADDYIEKPFDVDVLQSRVKNLLKSRKTLREKYLMYGRPDEHILPSTEENADELFLKKAYQLIKDNIDNTEFSIDDFSGAMMVSRSLLYRKIKSLTDLSPIEYLTYIRMRYASNLLKTRQFTIKEISYRSGFSDPRYFSTLFKKHFSKTPSEFISDIIPKTTRPSEPIIIE
jgi:signal transduction histidine kinase/DNA-binding response OmpR family regulator/ligand-binding sensor domain-containing protein